MLAGISVSTLMLPASEIQDDEFYVSCSGMCRTDFGGFCGFITLSFKELCYPSINSNEACTGEIGARAKIKFVSD